MKEKAYCEICGKFDYLDVHELLFGAQRKQAIKDGLQMSVCRSCHEEIQHKSGAAAVMSRMLGQMRFEVRLICNGISPDIARSEFIKRYGRNYL
jgi:uncharacterized protein YlaI